MPELGDQIYCSQQICIPPTFPYLLRQFAKAAIKTQPSDLLIWATTYFRCLSLNIPPPVKPRLEYPIPRDYHGITPGWLQALLHQTAGSPTVSFKVLWNRWIGACLHHQNLIQILCLGGFDDNTAVPWLRFLALSAAHLTDNLTKTMILVCEILTDEPEGGSASIPLTIFLDLYQFLARIDASVPQTLKNYYFLDKFLDLFEERIARDAGGKGGEEMPGEGLTSVASTVSTTKPESEERKDEVASLASCPSITSQDPDNYMKLLMKMQAAEGELEEELTTDFVEEAQAPVVVSKPVDDEDQEQKMSITSEMRDDEAETASKRSVAVSRFSEQLADDAKIEQFPKEQDQEDLASLSTKISSIKEVRKSEEQLDKDQEHLVEDLEKLRAIQEEVMGGESDEDLEKYKSSILAEAGLTASQIMAPEHFQGQIPDEESVSSESLKSDATSTSETSGKEKQAFEVEYEDVAVDAIPGIGPRVPEEMIVAVCNYMKKVAECQHGVVMPRNIRHFECPPLEVYD